VNEVIAPIKTVACFVASLPAASLQVSVYVVVWVGVGVTGTEPPDIGEADITVLSLLLVISQLVAPVTLQVRVGETGDVGMGDGIGASKEPIFGPGAVLHSIPDVGTDVVL
jgi:hypothetical protein